MKWIKDIKTKPWLTILSGFIASTTNEPDDTAIITEYFAAYLQNIVAERTKPAACETNHLYNKPYTASKTNLNHPEKPLRILSPLKQVQ